MTEESTTKAPRELLKAQSLANLLDYSVRIPFIGLRIGLDAIVGLIPGIGDFIMLLASLRIVHLAKKMGLPKPLLSTMLRNCVIDFGLGFIPLIGDIADIFFKANIKNVRLMEQYWLSQNKQAIQSSTKQKVAAWEKQQEQTDKD